MAAWYQEWYGQGVSPYAGAWLGAGVQADGAIIGNGNGWIHGQHGYEPDRPEHRPWTSIAPSSNRLIPCMGGDDASMAQEPQQHRSSHCRGHACGVQNR